LTSHSTFFLVVSYTIDLASCADKGNVSTDRMVALTTTRKTKKSQQPISKIRKERVPLPCFSLPVSVAPERIRNQSLIVWECILLWQVLCSTMLRHRSSLETAAKTPSLRRNQNFTQNRIFKITIKLTCQRTSLLVFQAT